MHPSVQRALNRVPVGGIARYARKFYELLGNRRKFERVPMSGTVFVVRKGSVVDETHVCSCLDISPRGIALDCPEPLAVDSFVQLYSDDHASWRLARVRHCGHLSSRYRVGLEFVAKPEWGN
jgi:PilZ domain